MERYAGVNPFVVLSLVRAVENQMTDQSYQLSRFRLVPIPYQSRVSEEMTLVSIEGLLFQERRSGYISTKYARPVGGL